MATEVVKVIDPDQGAGHDYHNLTDWEAAQQGDLTGVRDEIAVAKCRNTSGGGNAERMTIDGWTVASDHYIKIWTDPSENYRHQGVWDSSKYYMEYISDVQTDWIIVIKEQFVRIDGIQFSRGDLNSPVCPILCFELPDATGDCWVSNCIFKNPDWTNRYMSNCIRGMTYYSTLRVWNNIFYDQTHASYGAIWFDGDGPYYAYNNTFNRCTRGIYSSVADKTKVFNNLFKSCTTDMAGTYVTGSGYNVTSNASLGYTVTGGATGDHVSHTITFVGTTNFHLDSTDSGAKGFALNLYNDAYIPFQTDIDGQDRGGSGASWDVGADEYVTYTEVEGTTCWGHDTGVTETNVHDFSSIWSGTGSIVSSGDGEHVELNSGEYMECSEIIYTGSVTVTIEANHYAAGDAPTIKYKTGATAAACFAVSSWTTYSAPFASSGYVQIRIEAS